MLNDEEKSATRVLLEWGIKNVGIESRVLLSCFPLKKFKVCGRGSANSLFLWTINSREIFQVNDYIRKLMYVYDDQQYGVPVLTAKESLKGAFMVIVCLSMKI